MPLSMSRLMPDSPIEGDTRARLLEAGLRLFATRGYDSVSTRELAKMAGVNIAAIAYHFGGKQDLYHAVARQQVSETDPIAGPVVTRVATALAETQGDPAKLSGIAEMLVNGLLRAFTQSERMRLRAALILRELANPTSGFDIMFKGRIEPMHKAITELTAVALGLDPLDEKALVRGHAVTGQILFFFIGRVVLFARTGWSDFGEAEVDLVCREVTDSVVASLGLPPIDRTEETK